VRERAGRMDDSGSSRPLPSGGDPRRVTGASSDPERGRVGDRAGGHRFAEHERHQQKPAAEKPSVGGGKRVVEQQYSQREYNDAYNDIPPEQLEEMNKA